MSEPRGRPPTPRVFFCIRLLGTCVSIRQRHLSGGSSSFGPRLLLAAGGLLLRRRWLQKLSMRGEFRVDDVLLLLIHQPLANV